MAGQKQRDESLKWKRRCGVCDSLFKTWRHDALTCSPRCRKRLQRLRERGGVPDHGEGPQLGPDQGEAEQGEAGR